MVVSGKWSSAKGTWVKGSSFTSHASKLRHSLETKKYQRLPRKQNLILQKPQFWTLPNLIIRAEGLGVSVHVVLGARPSVRERRLPPPPPFFLPLACTLLVYYYYYSSSIRHGSFPKQ